MSNTADQLPGCEIPQTCLKHPDQGSFTPRDAFCEHDLGCMCKVDNNLANNSLFDSACLLRECTDGHERKLFLKNWIESCREVGKSALDNIPYDWEPYYPRDDEYIYPTASPSTPADTLSQAIATSLPVTSLSTLVTTTSKTFDAAPASSSTSPLPTATSPTAQPIVVTTHSLSSGAIGGIVAGILLLGAICAGLGYFFWKANKKATEKNREVAILSDRVSGIGFQNRIDELLADNNSSTGTTLRSHAHRAAELGSGSTVGVTSTSSSVYSVDIARAL